MSVKKIISGDAITFMSPGLSMQVSVFLTPDLSQPYHCINEGTKAREIQEFDYF